MSYPGVAQLVGRLVWELEHQIGGSIPLTRKPVATLALFFLTSPSLWSKLAFDHMFDHFGKIPSISYPGVAQLVGRLIWVLEHGLHP